MQANIKQNARKCMSKKWMYFEETIFCERQGKRERSVLLYTTDRLTQYFAKNGGIAQLVEHLLCKQGVIGSNPFTSTIRSV